MRIRSAVHEILADKAFIATDGLISQSFDVTFVHPTYVWIALIWGFPAQLSLCKSVHWLWRYKLNEVCDRRYITFIYCTHRSKYIKCNRFYKVKHHREIAWYCKSNFKTNPFRLKTKKGKLCSHTFKYINCKGKH